MKCPECGEEMMFFYGCGFDYDRWMCVRKLDKFVLFCPGEVELDETSYPEGFEE